MSNSVREDFKNTASKIVNCQEYDDKFTSKSDTGLSMLEKFSLGLFDYSIGFAEDIDNPDNNYMDEATLKYIHNMSSLSSKFLSASTNKKLESFANETLSECKDHGPKLKSRKIKTSITY